MLNRTFMPIVVLAFLVPATGVSAQDETQRKDMRFEARLFADALRTTAQTFHVVIGMEEVQAPPFDRAISLKLDHASITQVMNALIKADPRYSWRQESNGVIHVTTVDRKLTLPDVVVNVFRVQNLKRKAVPSLLDQDAQIRDWMRQRGCSRSDLTIDPRDLSSGPEGSATINAVGKTLRENLDETVKQTGTYFWRITQLNGEGCRISIGLPPLLAQ